MSLFLKRFGGVLLESGIFDINKLIHELVKLKRETDCRFVELSFYDFEDFNKLEGTNLLPELSVQFSDGYGGCVEGFEIEIVPNFNWSYKI